MAVQKFVRNLVLAIALGLTLSSSQGADAQSGCFSHRCRQGSWPMVATNNTTCPGDYPVDAGRLNFAHGETFFHVTLSADFNQVGSQPCVNPNAPGAGATCSDIGKSGFIYATEPFNELITQQEYDTRTQYICCNGTIRAGGTASCPPPPAACADGIDNDGDGLIDLADPGCSDPQDSTEDPNPRPPPSQCQDTLDNDGDGLIDLADPGCSDPQDSTEDPNPAPPQCQDGIDNDGDGATDLADFSCGGNGQKNDERLPLSQCQDGLDNDGDGAIDLADFSCGGDGQKNDERLPLAQCQDGIDNDGDGAIDLADFSCGGDSQKNDERLPLSQCQDGIDNDGDGAIDLADFSCGGNRQKNDERLPLSQCQDGLDNDSNGFIDLADSGCSDKQDNDESSGAPRVTIDAECLSDNSEGSKTAYFRYDNLGGQEIASGFTSTFVPSPSSGQGPSVLKPGLCKGCVPVTFTGDTITWTIQGAQTGRASATASPTTPRCAAVVPTMTCRSFVNGKIRVRTGWNNPNPFTVTIPIGPLNKFSPGNPDLGQPEEFLSGTITGGFNVLFDPPQVILGFPDSAPEIPAPPRTNLTWSLNDKHVDTSSLPVCPGECIDTSTTETKKSLDKYARRLARLTVAAANALEAAAPDDAVDAERARAYAQGYTARAAALVIELPEVIKICPEAPETCLTIDRGPTIEKLRILYAEARNTVKRVVSRAYFRRTGETNPNDPIIKKALAAEELGAAELAKIPRFSTECK